MTRPVFFVPYFCIIPLVYPTPKYEYSHLNIDTNFWTNVSDS